VMEEFVDSNFVLMTVNLTIEDGLNYIPLLEYSIGKSILLFLCSTMLVIT
jgi:hypothetical protein